MPRRGPTGATGRARRTSIATAECAVLAVLAESERLVRSITRVPFSHSLTASGLYRRSVPDGTTGDPGRDIALRDHQQHRSGHRGYDCSRHDRVPLSGVVADVVVDAQGDRDEVTVAVQRRGEDEVRPGPQEGEQGDGQGGVTAHWQDDRAESAPCAGAVDPRCLQQLPRDPGHEGSEQQYRE